MIKNIERVVSIACIIMLAVFSSCSSSDCEYINIENVSGVNLCASKNILNISTGIDESGNVIAPGFDAIDPYWRLINRPLFNQNSVSINDQSLINTINGNAFIVNYNNSNTTDWLNQPNSGTINALNAGTNLTFNASNVRSNVFLTPYIFERSFCTNTEAELLIDLKARGIQEIYFELVNNSTNTIYSTSQNITNIVGSWTDSVIIPAGSYSIRTYLFYKGDSLPAFSVVGNISTADDSLSLTNNKYSCCNNNIIALTMINDGINGPNGVDNCDGFFDSNVDTILYQNAVANILNSSGTVVSTQNVDANGNIIFAGLPDGVYTVQIIILDSSALITPNNFQVTLSNNEVKNFNIFVCP